MKTNTYKIQINGQVQGVGFRPFIYNLALKNNLFGTVSNNENGVIIFITTSKINAENFLKEISNNKPKVAFITKHSLQKVAFQDFVDFQIIPSSVKNQIQIPLTPDFAVCTECKEEITDKKNRRFNYAFTTCVHCGPRYAITKNYPFERANTTINVFKMCKNCLTEYKNPLNKRFHSQTNSCADCGIKMEISDYSGKQIEQNQRKIIPKIVSLLSDGNIIALKNTNGYLLCCDANNPKSISKLRNRKNRKNKPFAVLYPSIQAIQNDFLVTKEEKTMLQSVVSPIVILKNSDKTSLHAPSIAPNLNQTGVMLPSSALLHLIATAFKRPIIATSGNMHGSPIIAHKEQAENKLKNVADYFLHHQLEITFPQDDSVVKFTNNKPIWIRRSRGLAPNFTTNLITENSVLAMGSHLKSTFAFVPNKHLYISPYFGNLDNFDVSERVKNTIKSYFKLFNTKPKIILIDKHLQYQSSILGTELSEEFNGKLIAIQHHKAHFCSVLAENNLFQSKQKILGVIWDGTGFGDDKNIWGGEFFIYQEKKITRINHFNYFNWLANDKMAKEPRLALFSLINNETRHLIKDKFSSTEWKIYSKTLKNNTLKTSSVGRLFDAVASALDIIDINSYEAEAAMLVENCANSYVDDDYIDLLEFKNYDKIPVKLLLQIIIKSYKIDSVSKAYIAASFIYTLAIIIIKQAIKHKVKIVVCSGGVFQNSLLIRILQKLAIENQLELKINRNLPANDENISFGQLMYFQNIKN